MGGDGQVTMESVIVKGNAYKIRKIFNDEVMVGFAGAVADSFALLERFEEKLKELSGNVLRSATELARDWRTDRVLRRLESLLAVADGKTSLLVSGTGEVIEPSDGIIGIGSGGQYAVAAARGLLRRTDMSPRDIVEESLIITSEICIYTNDKITVEELS